MPLDKEVKVMQCWRCKSFGHQTGDKACPLYVSGNVQTERFRWSQEDPMHSYIRDQEKRDKEARVQELQALLDSSSSSSSDSDTSSSSLDTHQRKRKRRKEKHTKDSKKGDKHDRHKKKHKGDRSKKDDRDKHNRNRCDKSGEYDWVEKSDHRKDRDRLHRSDREESYSEVKKIHKEYSNHTKRERCESEKQGVDSKNELEKDRRLGENVKKKHKKHKMEKHKRKHKK